MFDNKAYIKTLEAIFAIIMLFIFVSSLISTRREAEEPRTGVIQGAVVEQISTNNTLRSAVLNNDEETVNGFVTSILGPLGYNFKIAIKQPGAVPTTDEVPKPGKNVYVLSSVIADNLTKMEPKVIYLYSWEK